MTYTSIILDVTGALVYSLRPLHTMRPVDVAYLAEELANGSIEVTEAGYAYRPESLVAVMALTEQLPVIPWLRPQHRDAATDVPWLAERRIVTPSPLQDLIDQASNALVITNRAAWLRGRHEDRPRTVCIAPWGIGERELRLITGRIARGRRTV